MQSNAFIKPSGHDYILIGIGAASNWDMQFLAWLKSMEARQGFTSMWLYHENAYKIPISLIKEAEEQLRKYYDIVSVAQAVPAIPTVFRVEYIGACKRRVDTRRNIWGQKVTTCSTCGGSGLQGVTRFATTCPTCGGSGRVTTQDTTESYASAWSNGNWSLIFPEDVLRAYFPSPVKFDGNFHKALLSGEDISRAYKQLSRQFHPDIKGGSHDMFVKLRQAFDDLKDPRRRKRYEAGLKFAAAEPEEAVVFRVPKSCGYVTVVIDQESPYDDLNVTTKVVIKEILSWNDIIDEKGRVMVSSWNRVPGFNRAARKAEERGEPPFTIEWVYAGGEFEIDL